ncbi:DNA-3-methyladenine glycosylase family protein [Thalassorhabdus alkalitolerans]|uniref:DNA-3-methyladenine glycosylase II n=1 Tax=Thalassorhabdus alkalitolerans TaxID=2282697 RepID=A0ABW0YSA3_9BACI
MWKEEIMLPAPISVPVMLKRLHVDPVHSVDEEKRTVRVPIEKGHAKESLLVHFVSDDKVAVKGSQIEKEVALPHLNNIFLWHRDAGEISAFLKSTMLDPIVERFKGVPLVCDFDLYGCLIKTIIHQQLNMTFAYQLSSRFVFQFGEKVNGAWFYPSPEMIAELETEDLTCLQFSRRKAEYVIDTSRLIADGKLDLEGLRAKEDNEIISILTAIRGVGPWTAECFLLFGLGRADLLPAADIGIQNALKKLLELPNKPSKEEVIEWSAAWSPYKSYAALYLWLSIENESRVKINE